MQLTVAELAAIMGGVFALTTTIIGLLVKMLFSSYREKSAKELEAIQRAIDLEIKSIKESREACSKNHEKQQQHLISSMEKINDSWFNFIREDAAMEATRGRKVDALFNVVDGMKDKIRQIPEIINKKIEDMYRDIKNDLRDDLREYSRELKTVEKTKEVQRGDH